MRGWRRAVGDRGEAVAEAYLKRQGFRILKRQLRTPYGEVDLLCRDGNTIVLVEVKARRSRRAGEAIERITAGKRRALSRSASFLAHRHGWHDVPMRFDVVAVQWDEASETAPEVRHVRGAFEASS